MKNNKHDTVTTSNVTNETKIPLRSIIKTDVFKTIWLTLYLVLILMILYVLFSALPIIFSYMYTSVGYTMGADFTALSEVDLVYWQMVALSTGAVFIGLLISALKKFFKWLTDKMIVKHVLKKSEFSNIIELKGKKN